jgi:hypothetical protein
VNAVSTNAETLPLNLLDTDSIEPLNGGDVYTSPLSLTLAFPRDRGRGGEELKINVY